MARINKISDVVDWRMCLGCGACTYICPEDKISLLDFLDEGIRPLASDVDCHGCRACLDVCPGVESDFRVERSPGTSSSEFDDGFTKKWGPVVGMWEGHATDPAIRFKGSSGGALTALSAYCLEVEGMHGVLQIAQDPGDPLRNRTQLSRRSEELIAATGSRYSPASVCNGLGLVEGAPGPCVVIGKPSEISAVRNACRLRPNLEQKVGLTMSFFCAETPATRGTVSLIRAMGAVPGELSDLRYRGLGWPGDFAPTPKGEEKPVATMTYQESWKFLQAFRPWPTQLWPDRTGELADIACGDPWYEQPDSRNPGRSLIVARSERGRRIVEGAIEAGYVDFSPAEPWKLEKSQSGLLNRRGAIWGRRLVSQICGLPVTRLFGLDLRSSWQTLPLGEKLTVILGTLRRIIARRLFRASALDPVRTKAVPDPIVGPAMR